MSEPGNGTAGLTVASMNTRGIPPRSRLAQRYAAMAAAFEASGTEVACFQEVVTYHHLRLLTSQMPSFRHVSYRPALAGPAGGLATLSRLPVTATVFRRFPVPPLRPGAAGLPLRTWLAAPAWGTLLTRLSRPEVCVVNTHPVANADGDWSDAGRFHRVHRGQLAAIGSLLRGLLVPAVVCGDFNVPRHSPLLREFLSHAALDDAFGGQCPPTFRAEYLEPGRPPATIDFILISDGLMAEAPATLFAAKVDLPGGPGYVSDHLGLTARILMSR